jgi:MerR family transcriptional regulator, thiopeptide resistance regulator
MEARRMGISLTPEEQLEVFGDEPIDDYAKEAEQRWGETDSWRESQRRTAAYTKDDWIAIKREGAENFTAFADALKAGAPATSESAMDAAEAHRQYISRWFYECGSEHHRGLAELYLSDPRFRTNYEEIAPGLAQYVHDAIIANSER